MSEGTHLQGLKVLVQPHVLSEYTGLTSLGLRALDELFNISPQFFQALPQLTNLRHLDISGVYGRTSSHDVTCAEVRSALQRLQQLTSLDLSTTTLSNQQTSEGSAQQHELLQGLHLPKLSVFKALRLRQAIPAAASAQHSNPSTGYVNYKPLLDLDHTLLHTLQLVRAFPSLQQLEISMWSGIQSRNMVPQCIQLQALQLATRLVDLDLDIKDVGDAAGKPGRLLDDHMQQLSLATSLQSLKISCRGDLLTELGLWPLTCLSALTRLLISGISKKGISMQVAPLIEGVRSVHLAQSLQEYHNIQVQHSHCLAAGNLPGRHDARPVWIQLQELLINSPLNRTNKAHMRAASDGSSRHNSSFGHAGWDVQQWPQQQQQQQWALLPQAHSIERVPPPPPLQAPQQQHLAAPAMGDWSRVQCFQNLLPLVGSIASTDPVSGVAKQFQVTYLLSIAGATAGVFIGKQLAPFTPQSDSQPHSSITCNGGSSYGNRDDVTWPEYDDTVALKVMYRPGETESDRLFCNEANILHGLRYNPSFMQLLHVGKTPHWSLGQAPLPTLIMKLYSCSLADVLLDPAEQLTICHARNYTRQAVHMFADLHSGTVRPAANTSGSRGQRSVIIHGDLKSSNLMCSKGDGHIAAAHPGAAHRLSLADFGGAVAISTPTGWSPSDYSKQPIKARLRHGTPYFASEAVMSGQLVGPEADCHTLGILPLELLVGGSQEFKSWVPLNKDEQGRITNYSTWTDIIRQFVSGQLLPDLCADTDALQEEMDMARTFMAVARGLREPPGRTPHVANSSSGVTTIGSADSGDQRNSSTNSAEPIVPTARGLLETRWMLKTPCSRMPTEQCPVCSGSTWVEEASP